MMSRRQVLRQWVLSASSLGASASRLPGDKQSAEPPPQIALSNEDQALLEEIEKVGFLFFWEQVDAGTGLAKDRCNAIAHESDKGIVASIAATGFGLTALCIGHKRGYAPPGAIVLRVIATLRFLWQKMPTHRGFFFHWANIATGERIWDSEVSTIDTAILLCGILTCREYFHHSGITNLANAIFNRVDWTWVSEDTSLLSHGWTPEVGFLPYRWDDYSEMMMLYLLGLGSSTYPLPDGSWSAWKRTTFEYDGLRYIGSYAPLFVHQYTQAWFDFRGKRDRYADYFKNSTISTEVHRRFCLELAPQFPDYSEDLWGITASDSKHGYVVWGGPLEIGPIDGTVVPSANGRVIIFHAPGDPSSPEKRQEALRNPRLEPVWLRKRFQSPDELV
jgi:hypothetical protein